MYWRQLPEGRAHVGLRAAEAPGWWGRIAKAGLQIQVVCQPHTLLCTLQSIDTKRDDPRGYVSTCFVAWPSLKSERLSSDRYTPDGPIRSHAKDEKAYSGGRSEWELRCFVIQQSPCSPPSSAC